MSTPLVPDASVAVKWLIAEDKSDLAQTLLETDTDFHAPNLLRVEVAAAIARHFRLGLVDLADARERLAEAADLIAQPRINFVTDASLLVRAGEIALQIKHGLQDCLYVACAERYGAELLTADQTLFRRAETDFPFVKLL